MRWRIRRGEKGIGAQDQAAAPSSSVPGTAEAGGRSTPGRPAWSTLPAMGPSWSAPPLTSTPDPVRPLITDRRRPATSARADGAPEPGRVVGLASVIVPPPVVTAEPDSRSADYFAQQPPLRHVTARPIVEHAPLTRATDDYVGPPTAVPTAPPPAPTPPPSAPPRTAPGVEAMTEAGARFREALANLHRSGLPEYHSPGTEPARPTPPPAAPEPSPPAAPAGPPMAPPRPTIPGTEGPALTHRRNSLAQSRRLGLGAPISREPESRGTPAADTADDAGDPPAAQAATPPPPPTPPSPPLAEPVPSGRTEPAPPPPVPAAPVDAPGPREPLRPTPTVQPIAGGVARATITTAPLVFRATPRPAAPETPAPPALPRAKVTRAPAELAQALRSSHGIDVSDVPVKRDTAVDHEASARRARAFTRGAIVHLPSSAGDLTSSGTRALLAHELVHAAQQRRLGGALPAEHTPEGSALEAEALAAERSYGGSPDLTSTEPMRHAPAPITQTWVDDRITQHALDRADPKPFKFVADDVARKEIEYLAQEVIKDAGLTAGGGAGGGGGGSTDLDIASIGNTGAANLAEYTAFIQRKYDLEREVQGLEHQALSEAELKTIKDRFEQAERERAAALVRREQRDIEAEEAAAARKQRATDRATKREQDAKALADAEAARTGTAIKEAAASAGAATAVIAWTPDKGFFSPNAKAGATAAQPSEAQVAAAISAMNATTGSGTKPGGDGAGGTAAGVSTDKSAATKGAGSAVTPVVAAGADDFDETPNGNPAGFNKYKAETETEFVAMVVQDYNLALVQSGQDPIDPDNVPSGIRSQIGAEWANVTGRAAKAHAAERLKKQQKAEALATRKKTHEQGKEARLAAAAATGAAIVASAEAQLDEANAAEQAAAGVVATRSATAAATAPTPAVIEPPDVLATDRLEELTDRIYDRLRRRLRTELIIDRERAGLLTDFR